jgi:hypothetical protein
VPIIPIVVAVVGSLLALAAIVAAVLLYRRRQQPVPKFDNPTFDPAVGVMPMAGPYGYAAAPGSHSYLASPAPSVAAGSEAGNLQWGAPPSVASTAPAYRI